jgi:hypothetical protein
MWKQTFYRYCPDGAAGPGMTGERAAEIFHKEMTTRVGRHEICCMLGTTMLDCPRCFYDQLWREPRTLLERLLFARAFECRICGYRLRILRSRIAAIIGCFSPRQSGLLKNPPASASPIERRVET